MRSLIPATNVAESASLGTAISRSARTALSLLGAAVLVAAGAEAVRGQSALDGFDPNANGAVTFVAVQPDGKIVIAGYFESLSPNGGAAVTRNHIARLNPDGTLDLAFNPNADGIVQTVAFQADGKMLVGGYFSNIGGQPRKRIARLDATTGEADSFDPNANGTVHSIVVQADGKILAGGEFSGVNSIGGQLRNNIARLDPTTGLADSFDPNASSSVRVIVVEGDGRILVGGGFSNIGGQTRNRLARLDPMTGLAHSFNPNAGPGAVISIAVQADGKILTSGAFTSIGGQLRNKIARLDPVTGLADSFDPHANGLVYETALQADGRILVCGQFTSIGGQQRNYIARLDAATGLADSFDPSASLFVHVVAVQADGKILAGGAFLGANSIGGQTRNRIARLETDGRVDQTLNLGIESDEQAGLVLATVVQPDGKILIGGRFNSVLGVTRNHIARINQDGTLDLAFNPNAGCLFACSEGGVLTIALQADGRILVGGRFNSIGGQARNYIARLDPDTGLADSFDPNADGYVQAIAVQGDGKILVAGLFLSVGGQLRHGMARLDPATGQPDSFDPTPGQGVIAMSLQADGKILVGGYFFGENSIGGASRNYIARLDPATGLADSFDPSADLEVYSIAVQPDGKILAGGDFEHIGGQPRNALARLDPVTGLADSFNPNANNIVYSIVVQGDGKILAGGFFQGANSIGGQTRNFIARLDPKTGRADSFDPNANGNAYAVYSIALQQDGKVLAGGIFDAIGGQPRAHFARLSNDTAALQDLAVTQTTVTWTRRGSSPQFTRVTFESSTDNANYALLGNGTASGDTWILTGLDLPTEQNFYIRARGYYRTGAENVSESIAESVRNAFVTPPAAQAVNLSTRMRVQTGDNVGIGGFIIAGSAPKHVLLRAIGPSLSQLGVPNVLADPVLELHGQGTFDTITNNDWRDDPMQEAAIIATGIPPTNDLESAIDATLNPGSYTAVVRGQNNTFGVGLIEVYDLSKAVPAKLANISTRAFVSTGDNIVIVGFMLGSHSGDDSIIVRGIGPSLADLGVSNALANPTLELRDGNGVLLLANNDWQDDAAQAAELTAAGLAPTHQLESGMAMTLPPGPYTALLAGVNNGSGLGLVEVYDRGAP